MISSSVSASSAAANPCRARLASARASLLERDVEQRQSEMVSNSDVRAVWTEKMPALRDAGSVIRERAARETTGFTPAMTEALGEVLSDVLRTHASDTPPPLPGEPQPSPPLATVLPIPLMPVPRRKKK